MRPIVFKRYKLLDLLGRGASGQVYRARDLHHGSNLLALKLLPAKALPDDVERLRTEFRVANSIRHPSVVRVFDLHTSGVSGPFGLTLELVQGRSLLDWSSGASVQEVLDLATRIAEGVSAIHHRGIAHRDIKADNILLDETEKHPRPVITDFGMAGQALSKLNADAGGTLHYLPPEVLDGAIADTRGDIYSFGVLLYRMLSGRFPFCATVGKSLVSAIKTGARQSLHSLNPRVSVPVSLAIERALQRDPGSRYQNMTDFIGTLAPFTATRVEHSVPSAADWPFVGRKRETAVLERTQDLLHPLRRQKSPTASRLVLLEGEAGIGKSRLVSNSRYSAQASGITFVSESCAQKQHTPYNALSNALRSLILHLNHCCPDRRAFKETLTSHRLFLSNFLRHKTDSKSSATTWSEERPTWIPDQFAELLSLLSHETPFVLAIEDIHVADPATVLCLKSVIERMDESQFAIILTMQRTTSSPAEQVIATAAALGSTPIQLQALERQDFLALIPQIVQPLVVRETEKLAAHYHHATGGRPILLDLLLHTSDYDPRRSNPDETQLPNSITSWVSATLHSYSANTAEFLAALAVADRPTMIADLCEIAEIGQPPSSELESLASQSILRIHGDIPRARVGFQHSLFRESVYLDLSKERLKRLHDRVATAILSRPLQDQPRAAEVAHHLMAAGRAREAARFALEAGKSAYRVFALEEAEKHFRTALEHLEADAQDERLQALEGLAEILNLGLRFEDAGELLRNLIRHASESKRSSYLARGLAGLAEVHLGISEYDYAEELSQRALRIAREIGDPRTEARALRAVSDTLHYQSRLPEAKASYSELVSLCESLHDELRSASAWHNLGWVSNSMRSFDEAGGYFRRAEAIYRRLGNLPRLANTLTAQAANEYDAGRFTTAVDLLGEALSQAGKSRGRRTEALCHANLGQARLRLGQFDAALSNLHEALRILSILRNTRYLAPVSMTIGWAHIELGEYADAENALASAREAYLSLEDQPGLALCLASQGNIHRLLGDPTAGRFWTERAIEIARGTEDAQVTAICLTNNSLAVCEEGDHASAVDSLLEARSMAREVGAADTEHLAKLALARILLHLDRLGEVSTLVSELLDRAEAQQLAADLPPILLLKAMYKVRFGADAEARALLDEGIARAETSCPSDTRIELRQFRILLTGRNDSLGARLRQELRAITDTIAQSISEAPRRRGFARRTEARMEEFARFLRRERASEPEDASPREAELDPAPTGPSTPEAEDRPDLASLGLCSSGSGLQTRLRSLFNLLVDRAVHWTQSERGGLFLLPRSEMAGLLPEEELIPVACRQMERESLGSSAGLSRTLLGQVLLTESELTSADVLGNPDLASRLTQRVQDIPAALGIPLFSNLGKKKEIRGVLYLDRQIDEPYDGAQKRLAKHILGQLATALDRLANLEDDLEIELLVDATVESFDREEPAPSATAPSADQEFGSVNIIGISEAMKHILEVTGRLARSKAPVLIVGETGTGKELIARALHEGSPRAAGPFRAIDCGALTEAMGEAELFGHSRGAFSGAERDRKGLMRSASSGTFFLDEIGNLPPGIQLSLLRALETSEVRPVGSDESVPVDIRLVAATNADLEQEVEAGRFRQDLYHRLKGGLIALPPLRAHMEDIRALAEHFLDQFAGENDESPATVEPGAWKRLLTYEWPGNVRELRMVLQVALAMGDGRRIRAADLPDSVCTKERRPTQAQAQVAAARQEDVVRPSSVAGVPVPDALEGRMILRVLTDHNWDKAASARHIGWTRQKLYRCMKNYGIPKRVSPDQLRDIRGQVHALLVSIESPPATDTRQ